MRAQKGPRAYLVFSEGKALTVFDTAKEANAYVADYKTRFTDAVKVRMGSRVAAEEYLEWHNYRHPTGRLLY